MRPPLVASCVLIVHPGPIDAATAPLVTVARLFESMRIAVPAVLGTDDGLGVIVVSDLGDVTLEAHLRHASAAERMARYEEAIRIICALQHEGTRLASPQHPPYDVAFDVEKLSWELEFFVDEFLIRYRGVALTTAARAALTRAFRALSTTLADEPRVLCHRDFTAGISWCTTANCTSSISRMRGWDPPPTTWSRCSATPTWISTRALSNT